MGNRPANSKNINPVQCRRYHKNVNNRGGMTARQVMIGMHTAVAPPWVTAYAVIEVMERIAANSKHVNPAQCRCGQRSAAPASEVGDR